VPVLAEAPAAELEKRLCHLSSIVLGSSELLRHATHCEKKMKDMFKLIQIVGKPPLNKVNDLKKNAALITNDKFNQILKFY